MYVAASLVQKNFDVELIDLRGVEEEHWLEGIGEANVYGITATTLDYQRAIRIARKIKAKCGGMTVLGGTHATVQPKEIDAVFDRVVIGEGELAFTDLLNDHEKGIERRYYQREPIINLDSIPFPARSLLPLDSIVSYGLVDRGERSTSIITSRGCPYNCSFCVSPRIWGRKVRFRSADNVVAEIEEIIRNYGVHQFKFQDDSFTVHKKRVLELCEKMEPLGIHWRCNTRVNLSDRDTLLAMKRAGCVEVDLGVESASQRVLDMNNKQISLEQAYSAIRSCKEAGLRVRLFFMIGLPGEPKDISKITIDFVKKTRPDAANLGTFVPYPGCDAFDRPEAYDMKILTRDYDEYILTLGLGPGEWNKGFIYEHSSLTREELIEHRQRILDFFRENDLVRNY